MWDGKLRAPSCLMGKGFSCWLSGLFGQLLLTVHTLPLLLSGLMVNLATLLMPCNAAYSRVQALVCLCGGVLQC